MDITMDTVANFSLVLLSVARIRRCAFLGGGFNYTSHAHARPFGPDAHLGRRRVCGGRAQKKQVESPRVIRDLLSVYIYVCVYPIIIL